MGAQSNDTVARSYRRKVLHFPNGDHDYIGYIENGWFKSHGSASSIAERDDIRDDVTPDEIAAFEREEVTREAARHARQEREAALLALCGLGHGDFVRFRDVWRDGERLYVRTRENGVDAVSTDAIRNPNYLDRETDDFDSTYATYEFAIPEQPAA